MTVRTRYIRKLRENVIEKYGGKCACCGVTDYEFLTINHMNGDGAAERRELSKTNTNKHSGHAHQKLYVQLRSGPIRDDINLLCWNCNSAEHFWPPCPHKR